VMSLTASVAWIEPTITELIDYEAFCGLTPGQAPPEAEHGVATS
jgi:hypothetical protein